MVKIAPHGPLRVRTSERADVRPSDERPRAQKPSRTDEARQVAAQYANDLREILKEFRKLIS